LEPVAGRGLESRAFINAAGHTTSFTPRADHGTHAQFLYRGLGQSERHAMGLSQHDAAVSTYFTRDPNGKLLGQRSAAGNHHFLLDGLGSVIAVTDDTGTVVASYEYDAFGNTVAAEGVSDITP
jgi:YD repeat-containing protein